jgi:hypothetical protein
VVQRKQLFINMKKKLKALKAARTSNKKIKPVKAFTGLEVALIAGAAGLAGQMMADKPKTSTKDPFKQYDPAMTPAEYVAKQTSASDITGQSLDPVTSAGESATKSAMTGTGTTDNEQEEQTVTMKRGGMVRGQGIALRGTRFKGVF